MIVIHNHYLHSSDPHYCNSRYLLRLAVSYSTVSWIRRKFNTNNCLPRIMDSLNNDTLLGSNTDSIRLSRRQIRKKNYTASRSYTLHNRLDTCYRSEVLANAVRRADFLRPGLWSCVHCGSDVYGRDSYEWSSRCPINSHYFNEQSEYYTLLTFMFHFSLSNN